jgi:NADH-quinone oxidoreductase subunit M
VNNHLISLTVFFPLVGALFQAFIPAVRSRWIALAASLAASFCAIALVVSMQNHTADLQAVESFAWVGSYAISYEMAIDGLNALLVLLIAILFPVLIAAEWNQKIGIRGMHGLFLILQTSLFGVVCAQDLFLQFFFLGLTALPFYFLVGIWGGEGRERAAFRNMVASAMGDALIFLALVLVYYSIDPHSFSLRELAGGKFAGKMFNFLGYELPVSGVAFGLISAGLSLRAPIWPFHGWFTQVAQEAPSSVFVALCAATVPVALYVFVRDCYLLFPETLNSAAKVIAGVGTVNLIMGGICAVSQTGLRRLLAFLCVSEVGIVLMGIGSLNSTGVVGAVYQQLILGLGLAGFGLFSGIISERTGHADFLTEKGERTLGGVATRAPAVAVIAGIVVASLLGFPGFGGFVGHALVIIGSYSTHPITVAIAGAALLLASYYLFTMYRCIFLGRPATGSSAFADLTYRERAYMLPVVMSLLFFGLYPKPLIELIRPTVLTVLSTVK